MILQDINLSLTRFVQNTPRAVEISLYVVRAFVRLRETLAAHKELAANTRAQLRQVFEAIR